MIKVWTTADMLLQEVGSMNMKRVPAGTCLLVRDTQPTNLPKQLAVMGNGIFDNVPLEWLTFEPTVQYQEII